MSVERETSTTSSQEPAQTGASPGEFSYAKMPSIMWFVIPFVLLMVYGYFGM